MRTLSKVCLPAPVAVNGGLCEYPSASQSSTAHSSLTALHTQQQVVQQSFPPAFFLDMDIFRQAQLELPRPGLTVPLYVSDLLGGDGKVREMAITFFSTIHPWMPFISKTWAYKHLLSPLSPVHADSALLLLSIQLINWIPSASANPKTPMYTAAKQFFFELETAGSFSIRVVQAGLLILLYELGHCIYPSAYMSVGTCARQAVALGFDKDIKQGNTTGLSWDKVEERRRVWWAIVILDRFMNLGNPPRMLATTDPGTGDILPADDTPWERGLLPSSEPSTIGSQSQLKMGRFARFAQATYLLGQVFRHVSDQPRDDAFYEQEAAQLNRTLHALIHLSQSEAETRRLEFCTQTAVCYCALLILEAPVGGQLGDYPTIEPDVISRESARMSQNFLPGGSIPLAEVSPFILHLLYQGCIILSSSSRELRAEDTNSLILLQEALKVLTQRWLASGRILSPIYNVPSLNDMVLEAYLNILAARKAMLEI
ncbi:uncharacterized protein PAC_06210 [Phialocephala subalpina]|uniref:Xylanolytic transcriptional activator regulatory domain-containing protein n=1 Tax=Phialocephala subalpina TaxID=576137 RepID=A0A1L7WU64_9HELO|nr:uncharacterized protein PAC_06210 [Phialocephala subalpina]